MAIWRKKFDLASLNSTSQNTLIEHLDIIYSSFDDQSLSATMPVGAKTHQPLGMLHGGASVVLIETLGSIAANLCVDEKKYCMGLEVNANHIRSVRKGIVTARAQALHLGNSTHVWQVSIYDEAKHLICIGRLTVLVADKTD